jgi:hypothetical protein
MLHNLQLHVTVHQYSVVRFKRDRVAHIGFMVCLCTASSTDDLGIAGQLAQYPCIRYGTHLGCFTRHDTHSLSLIRYILTAGNSPLS